MNRIHKYREKYACVFLAGYLALFAYSSFHFHNIDFNPSDSVHEQGAATPLNTSGDFVFSTIFTCQFNIVYNSAFILDNRDCNLSRVQNNPDNIIFQVNDKLIKYTLNHSPQLRAPPVHS